MIWTPTFDFIRFLSREVLSSVKGFFGPRRIVPNSSHWRPIPDVICALFLLQSFMKSIICLGEMILAVWSSIPFVMSLHDGFSKRKSFHTLCLTPRNFFNSAGVHCSPCYPILSSPFSKVISYNSSISACAHCIQWQPSLQSPGVETNDLIWMG